jgi:hypothetical protein
MSACKVPKNYFGLSLFCRPETLRGLLVKGLVIFSGVLLPDVVVTRKLKALLEDKLNDMFPPRQVAHMIACPSRVDVLGGGDEIDEGGNIGGGAKHASHSASHYTQEKKDPMSSR